jgi:hypothetical protein
MAATSIPTMEIGGPLASTWREQVLTRVAEQHSMLDWLIAQPGTQDAPELRAAIVRHLDAAREAALETRSGRVRAAISGATIERATGHLDAVECDLLRLGGHEFRCGQMPSVLAHVRRHLEHEDPRRQAVERLAPGVGKAKPKGCDAKPKGCDAKPKGCDGERVIAAVHAASSKARREVRQIRSFRNTLYATALALTVVSVAIAVVAWAHPSSVPLCFSPGAPGAKVVCPTDERPIAPAGAAGTAAASATDVDEIMRETANAGDVALIELLGVMAAALAAAVALRNIRGTSSPYSLPIALAVLKLPTGALTAFLAMLLMRGEFVPGLSALDSSAQILAWAVIFGYAQQIFTQLVDRQAHTVLDNVRAGGTAPATRDAVGSVQTAPAR